MVPNLHRYDWVVVNSSAGKDSQASLSRVVKAAKAQRYALSRIVVAHADLGEMEWPGTLALAREHAAHYGLRFEVERRPQGDLLSHVEERGMWPSSKQRYCTSDHKRGQIARLFTRLTKETLRDKSRSATKLSHGQVPRVRSRRTGDSGGEVLRSCRQRADTLLAGGQTTTEPVFPDQVRPESTPRRPRKVRFLSVFGFRKEESPARRKLAEFEIDTRLTNTLRHVDRWLPIHHWKTRDVWHEIHQEGTRPHWAYARGMGRLSCRFCIFAPRSQLLVSATQPENKELFERYVQVEIKIKHKFKNNASLVELKAAIEAGEEPATTGAGADDGCWNM